jgi:hypothetical protein
MLNFHNKTLTIAGGLLTIVMACGKKKKGALGTS